MSGRNGGGGSLVIVRQAQVAPRAEQTLLHAQEQTSRLSGTLSGVGGEKLEMSSTAWPSQQRQRWQRKGLSGAPDHRMAASSQHVQG